MRATKAVQVEDVMSVTIERRGDRVVASIPGQLTVGNRQELKRKVLAEFERGDRRFLIDLGETGYIDSSGLGVIVSLTKQLRAGGGELRLTNLNDDLKSLFELTRLDTLVQIGDSEDGDAGRAVLSRSPVDGPRDSAAHQARPESGQAS
jgi:anti-sigma B factor antagonist